MLPAGTELRTKPRSSAAGPDCDSGWGEILLESFPELKEGQRETHWLREPDLLRKEALQGARANCLLIFCQEAVCRDFPGPCGVCGCIPASHRWGAKPVSVQISVILAS